MQGIAMRGGEGSSSPEQVMRVGVGEEETTRKDDGVPCDGKPKRGGYGEGGGGHSPGAEGSMWSASIA